MIKFKHIALGIGIVALGFGAVSACQPVTLLNTITPSGSFSKAKDISFGPLQRHTLDMYRAETPRAGAPLIIFVHGGSWDSGSKDIYKFLAEGFTRDGFDIAIPNYRLWPEVKYPDFVEDNAKAVAWAAQQYPDRPLVLMGHSAGGYNILKLAMRPDFLRAEGVSVCDRVSGVVALSAPVGIIPLTGETLIQIFPDRFTGEDAPLNNVDGPTPPMLLINGLDDITVYPDNAQQLGTKITARGGQADVKLYPDMNHTQAVQFLSRHFDGDSALKGDIVRFIEGLSSEGNFCR